MSKRAVSSHALTVGPNLINIVLDLMGRYSLYLDISGLAYEVAGVSASFDDLIIVIPAATPTRYLNWETKVLTNDLKHGEQYSVYCVKPTLAIAGKLSA